MSKARTTTLIAYLVKVLVLLLIMYCEEGRVSSFSPIYMSSVGPFQLPKFDVPSWFTGNNNDNSSSSNNNANYMSSSKLKEGDKIVIFGGTGGVGQLVTKKLNSKGFTMRVAARDTQRADETLDDASIETVPLNLVDNEGSHTSKKQQEKDLINSLDGTSAVVISLGTTAFPTLKWKDGNTPSAIDKDAVTMIANAAATVKTIQKVVLVTSVGVNRIEEMPFLFLNLFGVLDCKRDGEDAVISASRKEVVGGEQKGFDYVIIRPGRLVGGPYTNLDVAKLLQIEGGAENGVSVAPGDDLLGDCKRDALAEAIVQCLLNDECSDIDFSIISNEETALSTEQWTDTFIKLKNN